MKEALSKLDTRVLIAVGIAALLLAGAWLGLWQPAQARQERALAELADAEDQLRAAQELVDSMRELQLESAAEIAESLAALESTFPDGFDDLQVAQTISSRISQGGLRLLELTLLEEQRIDDNVTAVPYRISVSGAPGDLQGFLQDLPEQFESPATWRNITLESTTSANLNETAEARLGATLDLWAFTAPRSVAAGSDAAADDEADAVQPDVEAPPTDEAPTEQPADGGAPAEEPLAEEAPEATQP